MVAQGKIAYLSLPFCALVRRRRPREETRRRRGLCDAAAPQKRRDGAAGATPPPLRGDATAPRVVVVVGPDVSLLALGLLFGETFFAGVAQVPVSEADRALSRDCRHIIAPRTVAFKSICATFARFIRNSRVPSCLGFPNLAGLQHDPHVGDTRVGNVSSGRSSKTDLSGRPPEQWSKPQNPGAGGPGFD